MEDGSADVDGLNLKWVWGFGDDRLAVLVVAAAAMKLSFRHKVAIVSELGVKGG